MSRTSVDLPAAGHAGDGDEAAERDLDVDVRRLCSRAPCTVEPRLARRAPHAPAPAIERLPDRY